MDTFLNYFSLAILLMGLTLVFYTMIYIHDIPCRIAKKRNHPQAHAIHVAAWLSMFTLHVIWPLVFIWALIDHRPIPVKIERSTPDEGIADRIAALERRVRELENCHGTNTKQSSGRG